jgi:DNA-directed RNA polymerase subunit RPC12/RpoP
MYCINCGYPMVIQESIPIKDGIYEMSYNLYTCSTCGLIAHRRSTYNDDAITNDRLKLDWSETTQ